MPKSVKKIIIDDEIETPEPFEFNPGDDFEGTFVAADADGNYHFRGGDGKLYLIGQHDRIDEALTMIEKSTTVELQIFCKAPGKFRISINE